MHCNTGMQRASLNAQPAKPWGGQVTTAESHTGFLSCHQRAGNRGFSRHRLSKTEHVKNVTWSVESQFLLRHVMGRFRIWYESLGSGEIGESHHECAVDKPAATVSCYHITIDQEL